MSKTIYVVLLLCAVTVSSCFAQAVPGELITPPTINIPYPGKVMTEINISDDNILGMFKQMLPYIGQIAQAAAPMVQGKQLNQQDSAFLAMATTIDTNGLMQALDPVKAIRVVAARYPGNAVPEEVIRQFTEGVKKSGSFTKVMSHMDKWSGVTLFAEPNNAGYIGAVYNQGDDTLYVARVVGMVDIDKLMKWSLDTVKTITAISTMRVPEQPQQPCDAPVATDQPANQ